MRVNELVVDIIMMRDGWMKIDGSDDDNDSGGSTT